MKLEEVVHSQISKQLVYLTRAIGKLKPFEIQLVVDAFRAAEGHPLYATGMGKAGHVAKKFAATMSSLGIPMVFIHPAEASHGDLGMLLPHSVLVAFSNSGKTEEVVKMVRNAKDLLGEHIKIVSVTKSHISQLGRLSDFFITYDEITEACHLDMAPTTSTLLMEFIGNVIATSLSQMDGFTKEDFGARHHGGYLGAIAKKED